MKEKQDEIKRIFKSIKNGRYYKLFMFYDGDYAYYIKYYLYNNKKKKIVGNWNGLGWYTTLNHAKRALEKIFGSKVKLIKEKK